MDEDFKEKIDAMRMTLELAMHDIEGQRAAIQEQRMLSETQRESIQVLATASEALLKNADRQEIASASQRESIQILATTSGDLLKNADRQEKDLRALKKITGDLVKIADSHDRRIGAIEGRA